jgi:hypothetical protein
MIENNCAVSSRLSSVAPATLYLNFPLLPASSKTITAIGRG